MKIKDLLDCCNNYFNKVAKEHYGVDPETGTAVNPKFLPGDIVHDKYNSKSLYRIMGYKHWRDEGKDDYYQADPKDFENPPQDMRVLVVPVVKVKGLSGKDEYKPMDIPNKRFPFKYNTISPKHLVLFDRPNI
jgi:hypothetical protein